MLIKFAHARVAALLACMAATAPAAAQQPGASLEGFEHRTASVNGVRIHYVVGGRGEPLVLLHGWPQSWYAWRKVMPALAGRFRVIAPDLRGFGDSSLPDSGYDARTMGEDIHQLVRSLGYRRINLYGTDIGVPVAYAYASTYPAEVRRLAVSEMVVPGFQDGFTRELWHFGFNRSPGLPEALVAGREREFLTFFYRRDAADPAAIEESAVREYVRGYARPGGFAASLGFYRALDATVAQNRAAARRKLTMPVLAIGASRSLRDWPLRSLREVATDVRGEIIAGSGHFVAEERPAELVRLLIPFFNPAPAAERR